jgi:hypothetical protein
MPQKQAHRQVPPTRMPHQQRGMRVSRFLQAKLVHAAERVV